MRKLARAYFKVSWKPSNDNLDDLPSNFFSVILFCNRFYIMKYISLLHLLLIKINVRNIWESWNAWASMHFLILYFCIYEKQHNNMEIRTMCSWDHILPVSAFYPYFYNGQSTIFTVVLLLGSIRSQIKWIRIDILNFINTYLKIC